MNTDAKATISTDPFTPVRTVSETSHFTYDADSGLLSQIGADDGQTTHLCYYPVTASTAKPDRSDKVPTLTALRAQLRGLKLEKDGAAIRTQSLSCPTIPDTSTPPLLAQCSYLKFPDGSTSEMNVTLFGYANASTDSHGVLMPDMVLSLEGVTVDFSTTPWTLTTATGRQGLVVDLQQVTHTKTGAETQTETTSTRWYKNNTARQTRTLTETTTTASGKLRVKSESPFKHGELNLTATVAQHIRSARSDRVLAETDQDELGRPTSMAYHTYDARDRLLTSTTYAWNSDKYTSQEANGEALAKTEQQWVETGNGTWIVTFGPDGRKGRTLLDGLQRPVRRELQRQAGDDDSAQNYVCLEEIAYGADGEPQHQCIYDYHPGGLCVRNDGVSLPGTLRDWFWEAEAQGDKVEANGTQSKRTETIVGTLLRGPLHSVEDTQSNHTDGKVTLALSHKVWNATSKQLEAIGLSRKQQINARGLCDKVTEKVGTVSREWTFAYDELGRRTQTTGPDDTVVKWAYEGLSTIATQVTIKAKSGQEQQLAEQTLHGGDIVSRTVGAGDSAPTITFKRSSYQRPDGTEVTNEGNASSSPQMFTFKVGGYQRPDGTEVTNKSSADGTSVSWFVKGKNAAAKVLIKTFTYNEITQGIKAERLATEPNQQSLISTESVSPLLLGQILTTRTLRGMRQQERVQHSLRGTIDRTALNNGIVSRAWHDGQNRRTRVRRSGLDYCYRYAGQGELEQLLVSDRRNGTNLLVDLAYDSFGRETQRTYRLDGVIKSRYDQTWSRTGQLLSKTWYRNGESSATRTETFTYETYRNELKSWSVTAVTGYEIQDRDKNSIKNQAYTYDALGNLLTCTTAYNDGASEKRTYAYDNKLQPTLRTKVTVARTPKGATQSTSTILELVSDTNGNLTTDVSGRQFAYTPEGQLQSVTGGSDGKLLASYEYDHIGRLASQWDEANKQRRVMQYKGDLLCGEMWLDAQSKPVRHRVLDEEAGLVVQCREMGQATPATHTLFLLPDPQNGGAEEYSVDASGNWQSQSVGFTPWGEAPLDQLNALNCGLGYNGQRVDPVTGAYHLGNGYRVYDPKFQAFFQGDNLSPFDEGGLNDRAYCAGRDPVNWHDPSGHIMVSRREQATQLASLDEMIRETTPPHHEPAALWEWLLLAGFFVLAVIGSVMTGGLLGGLLFAVAAVAFSLGAAELSLRQRNPSLSSKLGWASAAATVFDGSGRGLAKLGNLLMKGASKGLKGLQLLRTSAFKKLSRLSTSLSQRMGSGFESLSSCIKYRIVTVSKMPVNTIPGRVTKKQRDLLNASRPATPPANVAAPRTLHVPHVVTVDSLGDYDLYRRTYHPSDRVVMSFHGKNAIRGGKVEIPSNSQLNHYAPATGTANTDIAYIRRTNIVSRDVGLGKVAAGTGNITKTVPGGHYTSNYVIDHFEKYNHTNLWDLVEKHNVDILVLKPNTGSHTLEDAFNTLETAGHQYKVYDYVACRASEIKLNLGMKLPANKI
ncbi:RHS repeat-associated core domain-containing protein [Pseudomonas sp. B21-047]|uniref:RHS repeat-associated core domain-containing protein n=1 Tax=Pseudomonas sp. B21-047 TaxID=2895489 RepID=UPI00215FDD8C|nr:RHS repeat-associated core domain-containing protein [Pseudomonas sp. B21-047]UVL06015.1 RHS repeat-associated core domain-containing protein [Pseudomonas sp. B21-047]